MSLVTKGIGLAKKIKHRYQAQLRARTPVYLSPVRRIERVATKERICAMTFDDGPCRLPANPDRFGGKPLTLVLAETLERFGAKGTFDVVGDTGGNYPDRPGKEGSAEWGGRAFDHYPDFKKDAEGGVAHCPELVGRLLEGGHQLTSHTWKHILWGRKNIVYAHRRHMNTLEEVTDDLQTMDRVLREKWGYTVTLSRPPHYVDNIAGGFNSYDAYALMGYQYMAASYDGAGWLPLADYQAEVDATYKPMGQLLAQDPDALCGQIIFQKDGYNMARRSPVADGLEKQLELLTRYDYKVVTVGELMAHSPFTDCGQEEQAAKNAAILAERGCCVAFRDNTLRPDTVLTRGALAQILFGWAGAKKRIELIRTKKKPFCDVPYAHPYAGAIALAAEKWSFKEKKFLPDQPASAEDIRRAIGMEAAAPLTHAALFTLMVKAGCGDE